MAGTRVNPTNGLMNLMEKEGYKSMCKRISSNKTRIKTFLIV